MTFTIETISSLLKEIERAIERLRSARRHMKSDIERLEAERERRAERRKGAAAMIDPNELHTSDCGQPQ